MQPIGLCLISLKIIVSCSSIPTLTTFKALDKLVETYDSYNDYYEHDHDHSDLYDHDDNHSDLNNTNYDHSDLYHPINDRVNSGDDIENPSDSDQLQSDADSEDNAKNKRDRYSKNTKLGCKSNGTPGPPEFDESIVKLVLISGANLGSRHDLNCPYRGCPKPLIKWIKDGKEVKRRSYVMGQSEISINRRRGRLSIMNNRRPDDGFYTCIISNEYGSINHTIQVKSVEVRLNQKPEIKEPLENSTLLVGSNHTLVCEPLTRDNVQAKRITWWRHYQVDGSYTNSEGMAYCTELETFMETRLDLLNLQTNDSTYYSCSIENHFGSTLSTAFINVVETLDKDHENRNGWYLVAAVGITVLAFIFFFIGLLIYFRRRYKDKLDTVTHKLDTATHKLDTVKMHVTQVKTLIVSKGDSLEPIITSIKERQEHEGDAANFESEYKFPEDPLWEFPRHLLSFDKPLGEGNFGCVKLASAIGEIRDGRLVTHQDPTSQSKRVMVAVKMVKESNNDEDVTGLLREAEIMKVIGRHQNIINLIGVCSQPVGSHLLVLVEFAKYGNLKEFLTKRKPGTLELLKERSQGRELHKPVTDDEIGPVSLKMMLSFGVQVAKGMEFLSNRRCVHRDLAARNVLVADNFTLKVADFGLARDVQEKDYYRKEGKGGLPLKWMAPESIQERISTTMSDVWSFGILLWEILTFGDSPYKTIQDQLTLMDFIQNGYRNEKPQGCPESVYNIMMRCWKFKAEDRPGWEELVSELYTQHKQTHPDEYLDLNVPNLPTPPSSTELPRKFGRNVRSLETPPSSPEIGSKHSSSVSLSSSGYVLSDNPGPSINPGSSSYRFIHQSPDSPGHTTPHSPLPGLWIQPNDSYIPQVIQDISVRTCPSQSPTRATAGHQFVNPSTVASHPAIHSGTYQQMKSNSRFCSANEQLIHPPKISCDSDQLLDHKKTDPREDYVIHDERRVGPVPRVRPKYIQLSSDYQSQEDDCYPEEVDENIEERISHQPHTCPSPRLRPQDFYGFSVPEEQPLLTTSFINRRRSRECSAGDPGPNVEDHTIGLEDRTIITEDRRWNYDRFKRTTPSPTAMSSFRPDMKRGSSESGYGTNRDSESSESRYRVPGMDKTRHASDSDSVFFRNSPSP